MEKEYEYFFDFVFYSAMLHLPPISFHGVGGCWDRNQDSWVIGIGNQML
jgi:hypothetical protein